MDTWSTAEWGAILTAVATGWRDADLRAGRVGVDWDGYVYVTRPDPLATLTTRHDESRCV